MNCTNVRFWLLAVVALCESDGRFAPKSGHASGESRRLEMTQSGHGAKRKETAQFSDAVSENTYSTQADTGLNQ